MLQFLSNSLVTLLWAFPCVIPLHVSPGLSLCLSVCLLSLPASNPRTESRYSSKLVYRNVPRGLCKGQRYFYIDRSKVKVTRPRQA